MKSAIRELKYRADSPARKYGGFPEQTVETAKLALGEIKRLEKSLAWALNEISGEDYSKTPKHECEFKTDPEKGHCDFCCHFWEAVGEVFPNKFEPP